MNRNRVIYACEALMVGPAPSTGFHFMDYTGGLNNNFNNLVTNHNLIKKIDRVQTISYDVGIERTAIAQLGKRGLIGRPIINSPLINLSFDYFPVGVRNEARFGMNPNYAQFQFPFSGEPIYSDNFSVFVFSGLVNRTLDRRADDPHWPFDYRDKRNIFVVLAGEGQDVNRVLKEDFDSPNPNLNVNPDSTGLGVMSFGNCYLTSWETSAGVGSMIRSSVNYLAENMKFDSSGSGVTIPAIDPRTREPISGVHYVIPTAVNEGGPSALRPGDINFSITTNGLDPSGLGIKLQDGKLQGYSIQVPFIREPLDSLGYHLPIDREINFPIIATLNLAYVVGDGNSGSFHETLKRDVNYDVTIKIQREEECVASTVTFPRNVGVPTGEGFIDLRYDFRRAKLDGISVSSPMGANKTANLTFSVEVDPDDFTKGFFMSGLMNIEKIEDFMWDESGNYILDEEGNPIVSNYIPLF